MSEQEKIFGELPMVEFEDVVEFFKQRTTNACPACGHNKWDVTASFNEKPKVSLSLPAINLATGLTVQIGSPIATAECRKCAYIRPHDLRAIAKWIQNNKPEFKADE